MVSLIKNELIKSFSKKKFYVFMIIVILLELLPWLQSLLGELHMVVNGQNLSVIMLSGVAGSIIPLFIILSLADMITDEYSSGTLKLSLIHPVTRTQLLIAKIFSLVIIITVLLVFAIATGYIVGTFIFGWGDAFVFQGNDYSTFEGILITLGIYAASILPLTIFILLLTLLSLQFTSSGITVGVGIGLMVTMDMFGQVFSSLRPYLLTTYFQKFPMIIISGNYGGDLAAALLILLVYGITSYSISIYQFNKRDITV